MARFIRNALPTDLCTFGVASSTVDTDGTTGSIAEWGATESAMARCASRISCGVLDSKSREDAAGHVWGMETVARTAAKKRMKRLEVSILVP